MSYKSANNRRRYKRIKKPFMVSFRVRKHKDAGKDDPRWDMIAVVNLGAGGILFYYNHKLKVGTQLDLIVNFSQKEDPIYSIGKVIRVEELPFSYMFLVAVVFEEIDEKQREIIENVAEELHLAKRRMLEHD